MSQHGYLGPSVCAAAALPQMQGLSQMTNTSNASPGTYCETTSLCSSELSAPRERDRQRICSRRMEIVVLTANMTCSCRLDRETEKHRSEGRSWDNRESVNGLDSNSTTSKSDFLSLVITMWLQNKKVFILTRSLLMCLGVMALDSITYSQ